MGLLPHRYSARGGRMSRRARILIEDEKMLRRVENEIFANPGPPLAKRLVSLAFANGIHYPVKSGAR